MAKGKVAADLRLKGGRSHPFLQLSRGICGDDVDLGQARSSPE